MSNPMRDSLNGEVLYPDDLTEYDHLELASIAPLDAEDVEYEDAKYGKFIELGGERPPHVASAPVQLREFLANAYDEHGTEQLGFRVYEAIEGEQDHDEWEIQAEVTHVDGTKLED